MGPFDAFGGIDFSGAREPLSNLWTAVGEAHEGRLRIVALRPHAFRADLTAYVMEGWRAARAEKNDRILWGADFPFGLPNSVGAAIGTGSSWIQTVSWVADRPAEELRATAGQSARALRVTDTGGALPPLDLRLFKQTAEGLRWIQGLREDHIVSILPQAVVAGASVTMIEVYPSGTAQEIGLPRRRAPSRPGEVRARAAALRTFVDFSDSNCEALAVNLEDAWDATVACLTAFLCSEVLDQPFTVQSSSFHESLRSEGWIYRPPATLR
jgi:hypothetical protein